MKNRTPVYVVDDDGAPLMAPIVVPANTMRVRDARLRENSSIVFDREAHDDVDEPVLFFGPYLHLAPGRYTFRFNGELEGSLRLRLTADFAAKTLRNIVVKGFGEPLQVTIAEPLDKVEIIGEMTTDTKAMRLLSIAMEVTPLPADEAQSLPAGETSDGAPEIVLESAKSSSIFDDDGKPLASPLVLPANTMRVHNARLRAESTIVFDRRVHADFPEPILFFGPYLRLEPGHYSFLFDGELDGSLRVRCTHDFASKTLRDVVVKGFDAPLQVTVEQPADKVEIIGEFTRGTRALTLRSIEIAMAPLALTGPRFGSAGDKRIRLFSRAAKVLRIR